MDNTRSSDTAVATAAARAAHLIVDGHPRIFDDTLARLLLGERTEVLVAMHRDDTNAENFARMRVAITTRSRYTEGRLAEAVDRGIGQYVILGAGLDSFAYRSPLIDRLRVFEVDHPATQAWKRTRLAAAGIAIGGGVTFVPVDFGVDSLSDRLLEAGLDGSQPTFLSWLGVTQYLKTEAVEATLSVIGGFAPGSELVMEYLVPAGMRDEGGQALADFFIPRAAASGEPWLTFFSPAEIDTLLAAHGLNVTQDLGRKDQIDTALWERSDGLRPHALGRLAHAAVGR